MYLIVLLVLSCCSPGMDLIKVLLRLGSLVATLLWNRCTVLQIRYSLSFTATSQQVASLCLVIMVSVMQIC